MKTTAWIPLVAGLGLAAGLAGAAGERNAGSAAPPKVVLLDYSEADYRLISQSTFVRNRSEAFRKEPAPAKGAVVRGYLDLGGDATNSFPFLWLKQEGRLYLDLNRNEDLTDDTNAVFTSQSTGDSQVFKGVRLPLKMDSGMHVCKLELSLSSYGFRSPYVTIGIESCWRGKTSWQGQEVEMAVVEGPWRSGWRHDGPFLVLRPWTAHDSHITLEDGTADAITLPKQLFWRDVACHVARQYQGVGTTERCRLEFTEEKPTLGELRVNGAMLNRLILENKSGYTAVLDVPPDTSRIPVGTYQVSEVWVKKEGAEAVQQSQRTVTVSAKSPAVLLAGGPLTNSVSVHRRGKNLVLYYQLVGVDGGSYRLPNDPRTNPPSIAIFHQGKQVASGKFAYG